MIGGGPASLTVANDLLPLGYECELFDKNPALGGAMRTAVPAFRLPESVLQEEIEMITDLGLKVHLNHEIEDLDALRQKGFDAIFVGTGAPEGRLLSLPGADDVKASLLVGLKWLEDVAFGHANLLGKHVIVIGGGNTAMDCCRTALRQGAERVTVVTPEGFDEMLASDWEKEEAVEEGVEVRNHLLPVSFKDLNGQVEVEFQPLNRVWGKDGGWDPQPSGDPNLQIKAHQVILAVGQNRAFPFIDDSLGIKLDQHGLPLVDERTFQSSLPEVFFGGDAAFGPKNIITAVAHGHKAAIGIHEFLQQGSVGPDQPPKVDLDSQKIGLHEWSYSNDYQGDERYRVPSLDLSKRFQNLKLEVELGYDDQLALKEAERCLNCDVQTVFSGPSCIECDACIDICPTDCLTLTNSGERDQLDLRVPAVNPLQNLFQSEPLETGRSMIKDENVCLHCGLCAERCPTGAWDMQKLNLRLPKAGATS